MPNPVTEGCREARLLRKKLGYSRDQAIDPWAIAHELGIVVVLRPLAERKIAGAYLYRPAEQRSFIMINAADMLSRRRFTVAHEIGHFIFDRESIVVDDDLFGKSAPEKRANAFAAELLLPEAAIKSWKPAAPWGNTADDVAKLALAFGVGYETTVWRLKNVGIIDDAEPLRSLSGTVASELRQSLSARGEEITVLPEAFKELTDRARDTALISEKKYRLLRSDIFEDVPF
jgi:Zn-dependent peptidase ImmA (M78 family)